jgi:DNA-binding response OmpR family regulator
MPLLEKPEKYSTFSIDYSNSKILIVDDEDKILKLIKRYMDKQGYQVTTAADGEEGLRLFQESFFDCALVDLNLPKISGERLLQEFKRINPRTEVIIMTGYASVESAISCLGKLGAYDYITKPFHPISQLESVVRKALERKALYLENERLISELKDLNSHLERKVKEKTRDLEETYEALSLSYNELNHYISALININQLLLSIANTKERDQIIENVLQLAVSITDSRNALLVRTTEEGKIRGITGAGKERHDKSLQVDGPLPLPLSLLMISKKELTINSRPEMDTLLASHNDAGMGALLFSRFQAVPLRDEDRITGMLAVFDKHDDYSKRDCEILSFLANAALVAFINIDLRESLEKARGYQAEDR